MKLLNVTNHKLMPSQLADCEQRGWEVVELPEELKKLWGNIPPNATLDEVEEFIAPIKKYIAKLAKDAYIDHIPGKHYEPGLCLLCDGDFGAFICVYEFCRKQRILLLQSTMDRQSKEVHNEDGSVTTTHILNHVMFRRVC